MNDITLTSQNALILRDTDGTFYLSREREPFEPNWLDDAPTPLAAFDIAAAREIAAQLANEIDEYDRKELAKWISK